MKLPEYSISVIVPVFNEADNIQALADEVFDALAGEIKYELIFVDDGSSDETLERIRGAIDQSPVVSVCRHRSNRGQSAAVLTGVKSAKAEIVAVLDGDGQNDPADLPAMIVDLMGDDSVKMVIGHRRERQDSWLRRLSSRIANGVRSRLLHDRTPDTGCGIKVFYREEFLRLPPFDHMHRFLPALIQRGGGAVHTLPVNHRARLSGQSKYGVGNRLWVGIVDLVGVMWLQKRKI